MSDSQRIEFWLAGVVLDVRFALGSLSGIPPHTHLFLYPSPSCVSRLGNTSKCYPPLCGNISRWSRLYTPLLPLLLNLCPSLLYILNRFPPLWLAGCPSDPAFPVSDHPLATCVTLGEVERESDLESDATQFLDPLPT